MQTNQWKGFRFKLLLGGIRYCLHPLFFWETSSQIFSIYWEAVIKDTIEKRGKNYILVKEILQNFFRAENFFWKYILSTVFWCAVNGERVKRSGEDTNHWPLYNIMWQRTTITMMTMVTMMKMLMWGRWRGLAGKHEWKYMKDIVYNLYYKIE